MTRAFAILLALFAFASAPAFAAGYGQGVADKPARQMTEKQKTEAQDRKQRLEETERNYNQTIKSMPDSKEKFDPWKGSR